MDPEGWAVQPTGRCTGTSSSDSEPLGHAKLKLKLKFTYVRSIFFFAGWRRVGPSVGERPANLPLRLKHLWYNII